jgi:GTP-binding protein
MKISIVGLTNVGKSKLFNALCNRNLSIEFDEENTTTDYISCEIIIGEENGVLYDTAGLNSIEDFKDQTGRIILNCDLILYVIDSRIGLLQKDFNILRFLRTHNKKIVLLANKSDLPNPVSIESLKRSGVEDIFYISALKKNFDELFEKIGEIKSLSTALPIIGIIGRCNSGKSTIFNALIGNKRCITSEKFGTTRDSIMEKGRDFCFMDTAGFHDDDTDLNLVISKKRDFALKNVSGVMVVLDGECGLTRTDKKVIDLAKMYGKFMFIVINKKDLISRYSQASFERLYDNDYIPIIKTCALKRDIKSVFVTIKKCLNSMDKKIKTSDINRLNLEKMSSTFSSVSRLKYITQVSTSPLIFKCFVNRIPDEKSIKYIKRRIAETFKIYGAHVILKFAISENPHYKKGNN